MIVLQMCEATASPKLPRGLLGSPENASQSSAAVGLHPGKRQRVQKDARRRQKFLEKSGAAEERPAWPGLFRIGHSASPGDNEPNRPLRRATPAVRDHKLSNN